MFNVYFNGKFINIEGIYDHCCIDNNTKVYGYSGNCIEKFRKWMLESKFPTTRVYLLGYNNNKFDNLFVFHNWNPPDLHAKANSTYFKLVRFTNNNGHQFHTRDIRDFCQDGNLAMLGKKVKLPKLDINLEEITVDVTDPKTILYCARDINITIQAYIQLVLPTLVPCVESGVLQCVECCLEYMSISALIYQHTIIGFSDVYLIQGSLYEYGKRGYFGAKIDSCMYGRLLKKDVVCFDIRSMYPAAATNPLPVGKYKFHTHYDMDFNKSVHENPPFICLVKLYKPEVLECNLDSQYGTLPFKNEKGQTSYISHGCIENVYNSYDIYAAMLDGWVVLDAKYFIIWPKWEVLLKKLYDDCFLIKQSHVKDSMEYKAAKRCMNAGVGAFCQKTKYPFKTNKPAYIGWFVLAATRYFQFQMKRMCASVKVPRIYYGDTDSIFIPDKFVEDIRGYDSHIFEERLGDMHCMTGDLEGQGAKEIVVLGKKLYSSQKKKAHKGHYAENITHELLIKGLKSPQYTILKGPTKHVKEYNGTYYSSVSPWYETKRHFRVVVPEYKRQCNKCKFWYNVFIYHSAILK